MFNSKKSKHRKAARIETLIGENTHIKGDIHFSGGLRIDGVITGNITADEGEAALLTLSEKGRIEGEVRVPFQLINGDVKGNIYAAEHIELAAKARINGNVFYKLLEVAVGSEVNGQLIHVGEAEESNLNLEHSQTDANLNLEQNS
ncbi:MULTISPECIES: polymer-forming cytoskeletal protein [unclassified Methylophaga]|jgi:cytoskeletal protein CcmA (bactofilin family)|uniref:bactofilin family protein n=1 Tax=unclassified Methylophaga TaxID=2629249 RepID=UPI000C8A7578|nr:MULTISPECIES: polymer-forming cytoskeletal protein [unclassified Methylophaga]MAY17694.1 cell shape determination protein CcmA [Methylophaga sp.]MBN47003.1 cell shape determination protein CcmA [Methylophaga sp.]HAO25805.1 cell shape determination protein CcmA [Methylophaga sp.]HCD05496.1 cell shape determination protein CcmA [Methylophaga sp.]|tara:strand:+ start:6321 stop:6758 length:438 start_codon:yes stop_codon:yes gene_type:complete